MRFEMLSLLLGSGAAAAVLDETAVHQKLWAAYKTRFNIKEEPGAFSEFEKTLAAAAKAKYTPPTCADCYEINKGESGDCGSMFGCNNELCDFCTNHVTCQACYQLHQGASEECCGVAGCVSTLCSFCTNTKDCSVASPPPPPTSSPPPSGCTGGSLSDCITGCPSDPILFGPCVAACTEACSPKPPPPPAVCEGETLGTCIAACPSDPDIYQKCVQACVDNCPHVARK